VEGFLFLSVPSSMKRSGIISSLSTTTNTNVPLIQLMEVKPASVPADLDGIRECRQSALMDDLANYGPLHSERRFFNADAVAEKKVQCIITREKLPPWRVLGTADVRFSNSGDAYVNNVYVRKEFQGQGIGKTLMRGVEELVRRTRTATTKIKTKDHPTAAADAGPVVIELSLSVYTRNRAAMNLYRRCGYETRGIHSMVFTLSESTGLNLMVVMKKELSL
jgi:ribosomal protein S18 acetylase RimI-like enzyme